MSASDDGRVHITQCRSESPLGLCVTPETHVAYPDCTCASWCMCNLDRTCMLVSQSPLRDRWYDPLLDEYWDLGVLHSLSKGEALL